MSGHAYSEKALVERAAMEVLSALQWARANAYEEAFGPGGRRGR